MNIETIKIVNELKKGSSWIALVCSFTNFYCFNIQRRCQGMLENKIMDIETIENG